MARPAAPDGNALRTQRTVERILAQSLRLFNDRGEANVTTGMIADSLDMRDRKSTRLNSSHIQKSRMPSSA